MTLNDTVSYLLYNNPVSKTTAAGVNYVAKSVGIKPAAGPGPMTRIVAEPVASVFPLWRQIGANYIFIRVAAISGASAVCLAAYGRHKFKDAPEAREFQNVFESANSMHLIHSVVLLTVPLATKPVLTGSLFIAGTLLFSGTCYYKAIQKSKGKDVSNAPSYLAPYGGICLILGWLSFFL